MRTILLEPIVPGTDASSVNSWIFGNNKFFVISPPKACLLEPILNPSSGMSDLISSLNPSAELNNSSNLYVRSHFSNAFNSVLSVLANGATTWCDKALPSIFSPFNFLTPVQPLGVRRIIMGKRGDTTGWPLRASAWMALIFWYDSSSTLIIRS